MTVNRYVPKRVIEFDCALTDYQEFEQRALVRGIPVDHYIRELALFGLDTQRLWERLQRPQQAPKGKWNPVNDDQLRLLLDTYNPTAVQLATFFGVTIRVLRARVALLGLVSTKGSRPRSEQIKWAQFLKEYESESESQI